MSTPHRVQLRRIKGWRLPENTVSVARPSKWGNPYRIGDSGCNGIPYTRDVCIGLFAHYGPDDMPDWNWRFAAKSELRGKNLACFCKIVDADGRYCPCHADILLALSNDMTIEEVRAANIAALCIDNALSKLLKPAAALSPSSTSAPPGI
jgi:hypothetical protein